MVEIEKDKVRSRETICKKQKSLVKNEMEGFN
jgi:uncharacterized protein (DUF3084 family)